MTKAQRVLLLLNSALICGFGLVYLARRNYEFIIYVGVIVFFVLLIVATRRKVNYTTGALVALTVWAALHLAGGAIPVGDGRLYEVMLIRLSSRLPVFRYDQFVHIWGFGAATVVMYCLLSRSLARNGVGPVALSVVLAMAGLGVGAFNEIVEFLVSSAVPESGVGGYINTSLDLCADLMGACLGVVYVQFRYVRGKPKSGAPRNGPDPA